MNVSVIASAEKLSALHLAASAAVHRVGASCAELRSTSKCSGAAADLLVRREPDPDRRRAGSPDAASGTRPRVTISATPALLSAPSSVVPDAVTMSLPDLFGERRILGQPEHGVRRVGQHEVAAVVAAVDDRLHAGARHLRRRVDVRDESDRRHAGLAASWPESSPSRSRARRPPRRPGRARELAGEIAQQHELLRPCSDRSSSARPTACRSERSGGSARERKSSACKRCNCIAECAWNRRAHRLARSPSPARGRWCRRPSAPGTSSARVGEGGAARARSRAASRCCAAACCATAPTR